MQLNPRSWRDDFRSRVNEMTESSKSQQLDQQLVRAPFESDASSLSAPLILHKLRDKFRAEAWRVGLILLALIWSLQEAHAQNQVRLSEVEIYKRCYARLTRSPAPDNDTQLRRVSQGLSTGAAACLALIDSAQLRANAQGQFQLADAANMTSSRVLQTLHDVHRTWLQGHVRNEPTPALINSVVQDVEEQALYFTRAALGQGQAWSGIVRGEDSLRSMRVRDLDSSLTRFQAQTFFNYSGAVRDAGNAYDDYAMAYQHAAGSANVTAIHFRDEDIVATGRLIGLERGIDFRIPLIYNLGTVGSYSRLRADGSIENIPLSSCRPTGSTTPSQECLDFRASGQQARVNVPLNNHAGGGILGSVSFISHNTNLTINQIPNGEDMIHRRLGGRVYEDLLCLTLPALDPVDVVGDVQPDSHFAFRRSAACMTCHSSIDPVANGYRHIHFRESAVNNTRVHTLGMGLHTMIKLPTRADTQAFPIQTPSGTLRYRDRLRPTVAPVNLAFTSLEQLGQRISSRPEFYRCAAKRYYKYFTGVDVNLNAVELEPLSKAHQDFVLNRLATELQRTQSFRSMMKVLFESDIYRTRNYQTEAVSP